MHLNRDHLPKTMTDRLQCTALGHPMKLSEPTAAAHAVVKPLTLQARVHTFPMMRADGCEWAYDQIGRHQKTTDTETYGGELTYSWGDADANSGAFSGARELTPNDASRVSECFHGLLEHLSAPVSKSTGLPIQSLDYESMVDDDGVPRQFDFATVRRKLDSARQTVDTSRWWTLRWPNNAISLLGTACGLNTDGTYKLLREMRKVML